MKFDLLMMGPHRLRVRTHSLDPKRARLFQWKESSNQNENVIQLLLPVHSGVKGEGDRGQTHSGAKGMDAASVFANGRGDRGLGGGRFDARRLWRRDGRGSGFGSEAAAEAVPLPKAPRIEPAPTETAVAPAVCKNRRRVHPFRP